MTRLTISSGLPTTVLTLAAAIGLMTTAVAGQIPFDGWRGLRVIPLDGRAERLLVADLGGDGRDDVVVVNPRQARLDLFRWLPPAERTRSDAGDTDRPNELPLAPDWAHGEVSIDEMPVDAVVHDVDGDGRPELLVLTTPSNRVSIYAQSADKAVDAKGAWRKTGEWNLLGGTPTGKSGCLLVRDLSGGRHELLVSCEQGIQQVPLVRGSRAVWLAPRESRGRIDWSLADLDGDGDRDLVEWSSVARQIVRWYPCEADGSLLAAQTIHDQPIEGLQVGSQPAGAADIYLLGGSDKGVLRRYQLAAGEPTDVGRHDALPLATAARRGWCGMLLGTDTAATPAIVAVDSAQPRLRMHRLGTAGWLAEESFPSLGGVKALAAPAAAAGTLLVWVKDAADLHRCRWENGRLTYPQPWTDATGDRKIVALDSVGSTVWWAQRVGGDLDLFVWPTDRPEPIRTRYADLGPKVDQVVWLGGDTLLVQDAYATAAKLVTLADGKPVVKTPALLAKADLSEYLLLEVDGRLRKARLTDGVLQWLGDDLHPVDQVMLTEGQKIAAYVPVAGSSDGAATAWALEQGGGFLHRLEADDAGVMRVAASVKPPAGTGLRWDPILGMMLIDQERVVRLSRGRPWELKLLESIDGRVGRRSGVSETTIHRILETDLDGDGGDDVTLCDDRKHQLTAMLRRPEGLQRSVTWKVFEDRKYPYDGGESKDMVPEPRRIAGLDADGDGGRDLAMASQDRLVIYLAEDGGQESEAKP
ncbi:MAG: FG-GAP repeat domain-containing protein [Planctomycetota bacterium]